jgi:hypothetical protein
MAIVGSNVNGRQQPVACIRCIHQMGTRLEEVFWLGFALVALKFSILVELPIRPQISPVPDNKKD